MRCATRIPVCAQQPVPATNCKLTAGCDCTETKQDGSHNVRSHFGSSFGLRRGPRRSVFALHSQRSFLLQSSMGVCCAGLGIAAGDLLRSRVYCLAKWRNDYNSSTQKTLSVDTSPWPTADPLYDEVNACCSEHERTADENWSQSHDHQHMQFVWKIVEFPEILIVQDIQTSENLKTAPVRHMEFAETLEVLEFPVVVKHSTCSPVVEYIAPAPAMTYTAPARVVE